MNKWRKILMATAAAVLMLVSAACGKADNFLVKGTLSDNASINLRIVYYVDGDTRTALTAATDGKFEFSGSSERPTAVEIYDNDYRLLARFVAVNGNDIKVDVDRTNMYKTKVQGGEFTEGLIGFYNENAEVLAGLDIDKRNKLIAEYVAANESSPVSELLLATEFDASTEEGALMCDSLMRSLSAEARVFDLAVPFAALNSRVASASSRAPVEAITYKRVGNRAGTFAAQRSSLSVIAVSDESHGRDSVLEALRALAALDTARVAVLDLNVDADTVVWKRLIRNDSATWEQGWAAGSLSGRSLGRLGLPGIPYFVLADSTGRQLWRGRSASEVVKETEREIEKIKNKGKGD